MIIKVAVPSPIFDALDYLPGQFEGKIQVGMRVVVPFRRSHKVGVVTELSDKSQLAKHKLKSISEVFNDNPLPSEVVKLITWAAQYYHYPIGMAIETALPAGFRRVKPMEIPKDICWTLSEAGKSTDINSLKRAAKQQALLTLLAKGPLRPEELNESLANWRPVMKRLEERGWVNKQTVFIQTNQAKTSQVTLNTQQEAAIQQINAALSSHQAFLLHGITGSGKTEVYLAAVAATLETGKQCLLLVPEIGLTPQTVQRFRQRFGEQVVCAHSGLSDGERLSIWQKVHSGESRVLIGTRSALFAPFKNLGLILVDEEHDRSFKQQDGFRYHARDLAIYHAHSLGIPVVLGSATPSFESLQNAKAQRYQYLELSERAGQAVPPIISMVDSTLLRSHENLTPTLREHMQTHLERGEQVLLFLNRRGYAPALMCKDCNHIASCHRCDAKLTYHANRNQLVCHHCGYECRKHSHCASCHSEELISVGSGTERLEEELQHYYADYTTVRIDRDTTRRKGELEKRLAQARDGQAQILLGTQMLAKGHDFPNVTLVGLINIDQGLYSLDFRGAEYMSQLIVQVAGRAGRGAKAGKVIIQSAIPDHPLLSTLLQQGYKAFSETALAERESMQLPPFSYAALIRAETPIKSVAIDFLQALAQCVKNAGLQTLGPATAPMEKRAGRFRAQLWLQSEKRATLHHAVDLIQHYVQNDKNLQKQARHVRWSIDIDPVEIF